MAIDFTYRQMLLEDAVKENIKQGRILNSDTLANLETSLESIDLTIPQFKSADYLLQWKENASASKFNNTFRRVRQDIKALYLETIKLGKVAMDANQQWQIDSSLIEKELKDLESEIDSLLFSAQNTDGYFSTIVDNFTDTSMMDLTNTDCGIDLNNQTILLAPTDTKVQRKQLFSTPGYYTNPDNANFKLRTFNGLVGQSSSIDASSVPLALDNNDNTAWSTKVIFKYNQPVTGEINIKLADKPISLQEIDLVPLSTMVAGKMQVTPMYSVDNVNWAQLPSVTTTQEIRGNTSFVFPEITTLWIKLILTLPGGSSNGDGTYNYDFGFYSISFFSLSSTFDLTNTQSLISKPLYTIGTDSNPLPFSLVSVEPCEQVEDKTNINYFITTTVNDATVPVTNFTTWTQISPDTHKNPTYPQILNVSAGLLNTYSGVSLSYNFLGTVSGNHSFINPGSSFTLIDYVNSGITTSGVTTPASQRFRFPKPDEECILNYQLSNNVPINDTSLEIFRNVGTKGLSVINGVNTVRGTVKGWGFVDPWYSCVIEVSGLSNITIDVGSSPMVIDGQKITGVGQLSGALGITGGVHSIQVHKDNWAEITQGLTTEDGIKAADLAQGIKYPYNQKYIIEGYNYPAGFTGNQLYRGMDIFAEYYMKEVGPFDILYNIPAKGLKYFARIKDIPNGLYTGSTAFVVKVDQSWADFAGEQYMIRFKLTDQLQTYLRLRIDLQTLSSNVTPTVKGYKIKLG